jgi:N-acetylglucosamine-6-phosphate deacetylase
MKKIAVISNGDIYTPRKVWKNGVLVVRDGVIEHIGSTVPRGTAGAEKINARGCLVLPGFIDLHVHGSSGFDTVNGAYLPSADAWDSSEPAMRRGIPAIARYYTQHGTTGLVLTCTGAPGPQLERALRVMGEYTRQGVPGAARIWGIYLEGTFLRNPAFAGGQSPQFFRKPSVPVFKQLQKQAGGAVRIVNVVPEYGQPAFDLIKYLARCGVVPSIGHSEVSFDEYCRAIRAGVRLAVHLGNGPTATSFKPPGRNLEAALMCDECTAELILDGYHLNPAYVIDFLLAKDFNVVGITDCMFVAGTRGIRRFTFGGKKGEVDKSGECLRVAGSRDALFGSLLTMDRAFRNLVAWLTAGRRGIYHRAPVRFSFDQAVQAGCQVFAENPAGVLGVRHRTGSLALGKAADLVICDRNIRVKKVFIRGQEALLNH